MAKVRRVLNSHFFVLVMEYIFDLHLNFDHRIWTDESFSIVEKFTTYLEFFKHDGQEATIQSHSPLPPPLVIIDYI